MEVDAAQPSQHTSIGMVRSLTNMPSQHPLQDKVEPQQARTFVHPPRHAIHVPRHPSTSLSSRPPVSSHSYRQRATSNSPSSEDYSPPTNAASSYGSHYSLQPSPLIMPTDSASRLSSSASTPPSAGLASDMMSLTAGSPIFQAQPGKDHNRHPSLGLSGYQISGPASSVPISPQPAAAKGNSDFTGFGAKWTSLPPPVAPLPKTIGSVDRGPIDRVFPRDAAVLSDSRTVIASPRSSDKLPPSPRGQGSGYYERDTSAAHLLLNFSTSPQALRPQMSSFSGAPGIHQQTREHQPPPYATPQIFLAGHNRSGRQVARSDGAGGAGMRYPASAPGGAHAARSEEKWLTTPPLFALDDPRRSSESPIEEEGVHI